MYTEYLPTTLDLINFDRFQHETRKHGFYTFNYNISCNVTLVLIRRVNFPFHNF